MYLKKKVSWLLPAIFPLTHSWIVYDKYGEDAVLTLSNPRRRLHKGLQYGDDVEAESTSRACLRRDIMQMNT